MCIYIHAHTHHYVPSHRPNSCARACMHACVHACVNICVCACVCECVRLPFLYSQCFCCLEIAFFFLLMTVRITHDTCRCVCRSTPTAPSASLPMDSSSSRPLPPRATHLPSAECPGCQECMIAAASSRQPPCSADCSHIESLVYLCVSVHTCKISMERTVIRSGGKSRNIPREWSRAPLTDMLRRSASMQTHVMHLCKQSTHVVPVKAVCGPGPPLDNSKHVHFSPNGS